MNLPAKKETYQIDPQLLADMQECYPAIDVDRELVRMRAWLIANPDKKKTHRGMKRFINSWLSRARPEPLNKPDDRGFIEKHTDKSWRIGLGGEE
jgi:hypothetical protein